jgi:predicted nucleic acid-binding protein
VLTGDIALLPSLFEKVLTPERVRDELAHVEAPAAVRAWIAAPPTWLEICPVEDE